MKIKNVFPITGEILKTNDIMVSQVSKFCRSSSKKPFDFLMNYEFIKPPIESVYYL